ncbi:MAG: hypothetical protein VX938_03605, partial [Myxococcota bacterium]|nr:hypothetical protein [Myxococcota bacterium]
MIRGERRSTALMLGLVCLLVPAVAGAVPLEVPVQGLLRDNAGVPVVEDVFQVTFALYGQAEGGEVLWTESWPAGEGDCLVDPTGCVHVTAGTF